MNNILIPIIIGIVVSAALMILSLINRVGFNELINRLKSGDFTGIFKISDSKSRIKKDVSSAETPKPSNDLSSDLDLNVLNCRIKLSKHQDGDCVSDAFEVEICGSIHAPRDVQSAILKISIMDTTEPEPNTKPLQAIVKQWQEPDSSVFCYKAKLGKLPQQVTTIQDWTSIAKLRLDWLTRLLN